MGKCYTFEVVPKTKPNKNNNENQKEWEAKLNIYKDQRFNIKIELGIKTKETQI